MSAVTDEVEQERAWETWALSRHLSRQKRRKMIVACVLGVLITVVSATGALLSPKPATAEAVTESIVHAGTSAIENPVLSPDGSRIVFSYDVSGNFEIWEVTPQGRQLTRLTYLQGDSLFPQFSPDGKSIAFYHILGSSRSVMVMKADGSSLRKVTSEAAPDGSFAWSPDGKFIAIDVVNGGQEQVAIVNVENGGIIFQTVGNSPSWSPDSESLVLVAQSNESESLLAVANLTESYAHLVNVTGLVMNPVFFPNSTSIVFQRFLNDSWSMMSARLELNVTTMIVTSVRDFLTAPPGEKLLENSEPSIGPESAPIVQPNRKAVVFSAGTNQSGMGLFGVVENATVIVYSESYESIYGLSYQATTVTPLTLHNYVSVGTPSWSSDGGLIVFSARDSAGKYDLVIFSYSPPPNPKSPYG